MIFAVAALALAQISTALAPPAPACPKYQHDVSWHAGHNCRSVAGSSALIECDPDPPECVDDMHIVSEHDWQGLLSRIEKLESGRGPDHALSDMRVPDGNVTLISPAPAALEAVITYAPYDQAGHEFPPHPSAGETWHGFKFDGKGWRYIPAFVPLEIGMNTCGMDAHLHAKGAKFDSPDVKGAPIPIGDGRCHKDSGDQVVESRKKLEAKR